MQLEKHILLLYLCSIFFLPTSASAQECLKKEKCELCEYSAPELWIVNSRCAPRCTGLDEGFEKLNYSRYDACKKRFYPETREALLARQQNIPTVIFAHGNSLDHKAAMETTCWKFYERVKVCKGPKLMIFWSWPAEMAIKKPLIRPIQLARKNIRLKYVYAEHQGYYIAKLTSMMSLAQPLTLSGHSFGGVSAVSAMHYLGGGEMWGRALAGGAPVERKNLRGAIISGAMDNDSLYPGHRYGSAFESVELFYTTYNDRDSTLKHWPTHSCRGQQAVGYTGICSKRLGVNAHKLRQDYLTEDVKRSHYIKPHLASVRMMNSICSTAFNVGVSGNCACGSGGGTSKRRSITLPDINMNTLRRVPVQILTPGLAF